MVRIGALRHVEHRGQRALGEQAHQRAELGGARGRQFLVGGDLHAVEAQRSPSLVDHVVEAAAAEVHARLERVHLVAVLLGAGARGELVELGAEILELRQDEVTLGVAQQQRERELVGVVPGIGREEPDPVIEVLERRRVGIGRQGALAGDQVELGQLTSLLRLDHASDREVEMVDDVEDTSLALFGRDRGFEQPPDPQVRVHPLCFGEQRGHRLHHPVVEELVGDPSVVGWVRAFAYVLVGVIDRPDEALLHRMP